MYPAAGYQQFPETPNTPDRSAPFSSEEENEANEPSMYPAAVRQNPPYEAPPPVGTL